jgi:SLT domain-containing protein
MVAVGKNVTAGLLHGIFSTGNLASFVKTTFGGWPQALGSLVSKSLVDVAKLPAKALKALGGVAGKIGGFISHLFGGKVSGGVSQWTGLVLQALSMLGLSSSLAPQVLYQMQTESGGNPNAINNTDINAQMGDPSRGLLQTIGSTFATYHVAGTSNNIYDPLANIAAAINYARARYGPTLISGGMGMGSGHGYDTGGWLPPGATMAYNGTGRPELVLTADQAAKAMGGTQYHAHFDGLTGQAIESHVMTAFRTMSLTQGSLQRQGRRA